jgi:spore coat polysaccharide biosynthesis protein SpsF
MRTVAIIQARMGSSRLPGKVLLEIAGKPMLGRVIERTHRARTLDAVIVATTVDASDDAVAAYCAALDVPSSRGSVQDVLDRYYQAAQAQDANLIVRITADCPLIDPVLVDQAVTTLVDGGYDFVANRLPPPFSRSYPIGLDVEVCTFAALEQAWREADQTFQREHVMPFLYEGISLSSVHPGLATGVSPRGFSIAQIHSRFDYGSMRWTVDTPEDLEFVRQVYARFDGRSDFSWLDVLELLQREPDLAAINSSVQHKNMTDVDERSKN